MAEEEKSNHSKEKTHEHNVKHMSKLNYSLTKAYVLPSAHFTVGSSLHMGSTGHD